MADDPNTSDVSAIVEAFTPEQLAMFMARRLLADMPGQKVTFAPTRMTSPLDAPVIATVTSTAEDVVHVTVREKTRPSGYYIGYDASYAQDVVAYWDDALGQWRTTHSPDSGSLRGGSITSVTPLPLVFDTTTEEASDGK